MNTLIQKTVLTAIALVSLAAAAQAETTSELVSQAEAPCTIADGFQTVEFPNGSVYQGSFQGCRPLEGNASFHYQDVSINGHARPLSSDTVELTSSAGDVAVTVQMVTRMVAR